MLVFLKTINNTMLFEMQHFPSPKNPGLKKDLSKVKVNVKLPKSPPRAGLAFFIEILAPLRPRLLIWCVATSSL